jgi:hypothetical protein
VLAGGLALGLGAVAGCSSSATSSSSSSGTSTPTLKVLAFQAPSLGAFITSVITAKRFDTAHGLRLAFSYVTPDNYTVEFSSGQFQVGGSSALLSEALRYERRCRSPTCSTRSTSSARSSPPTRPSTG